jgi:hypothetical protein
MKIYYMIYLIICILHCKYLLLVLFANKEANQASCQQIPTVGSGVQTARIGQATIILQKSPFI